MGVGISRRLRRAETGLLFSQQAAPGSLRMETVIDVLSPFPEPDRQDFEAALKWWQAEGLRIGGGRSRGMGRVALDRVWASSTPQKPRLRPEGMPFRH